MKLLDINYKPFENVTGDIDQMFWVYDTNVKDFMIRDCNVWYNIKTDAYVMNINGNEVIIPETYNIIIGDVDAGIDIIVPSEIMGREFDVMTIRSDLEAGSWALEPITVTGFKQEVDIIFPFTKFPVPISISDNKVILVSSDDCYNKIKNLDLGDFV